MPQIDGPQAREKMLRPKPAPLSWEVAYGHFHASFEASIWLSVRENRVFGQRAWDSLLKICQRLAEVWWQPCFHWSHSLVAWFATACYDRVWFPVLPKSDMLPHEQTRMRRPNA
jgi:hypothetical protein